LHSLILVSLSKYSPTVSHSSIIKNSNFLLRACSFTFLCLPTSPYVFTKVSQASFDVSTWEILELTHWYKRNCALPPNFYCSLWFFFSSSVALLLIFITLVSMTSVTSWKLNTTFILIFQSSKSLSSKTGKPPWIMPSMPAMFSVLYPQQQHPSLLDVLLSFSFLVYQETRSLHFFSQRTLWLILSV